MSRIGKQPISVPAGVEVKLEDNNITVKGPNGELSRELHPEVNVKQDEGAIIVERISDDRFHRSLHGLTRTLIDNMVVGVTSGFEKSLEIHGVGYRAALKGSDVEVSAGYSHPVLFKVPTGVTVEVPQSTRMVVKGANKEHVGQVAANLRKIRPPEPYKGKGIRYADERVVIKETKKK